jgi:hypothetical protein
VIALGALDIVWGIGALQLRLWAWTLGVGLSGLNLIDVVYGFATRGDAGQIYIPGIVFEAMILAYLFSGKVRQASGAVRGKNPTTTEYALVDRNSRRARCGGFPGEEALGRE